MKTSKSRILQRVTLTASGFLLPFLFQNCAAPDVASTSKVSSLSSSAVPSGQTAAMSATYAPQIAIAGSPVTVMGVGGTPPYTYSLFKGTGELNGSVYTTAAAVEVATIMVRDSSTPSLVVTIGVASTSPTTTTGGGSSGGSGGSAATPTPVPAPVVISPSNADQVNVPNMGVMGRSTCNLAALASAAQGSDDSTAQIYYFVDYAYCLVLLRHPSLSEIHAWADPMLSGDNDPYTVIYGLARQNEFSTKYNINAMSPNDYLLFLSRLLLMTDPSAAQMATVVGDGTLLTQSKFTQYDTVVNSSYFGQANPICPAGEQAWQSAVND